MDKALTSKRERAVTINLKKQQDEEAEYLKLC
jgi:hypothetical protein